jgi:hypothetical protein
MHREISHLDEAFERESNLPLYLLTGLIGVLIGIDLWPAFANWAGIDFTWPQEIYPGYRIAYIAAILGGARVLYTSLEGLWQGRGRSRLHRHGRRMLGEHHFRANPTSHSAHRGSLSPSLLASSRRPRGAGSQ